VRNVLTSWPLQICIVVCFCFAFGASSEQFTKEQVAENKTNEIFDSFMSPFCPGRLLRDCPSSQASELKRKIESQFKAGVTEEVVINDLVTTYGNEVRAAPLPKDFGLVGWLAPFAFLLGGLLTFAIWLRYKKNTALSDDNTIINEARSISGDGISGNSAKENVSAAHSDELSPDLRRQIEKELRES